MNILLISIQKVTKPFFCIITETMHSQYLIMGVTFTVMSAVALYIAWEFYKIDKYRHNLRPGNVVNFKSHGDIAFKIVQSRPARDIVILSNMDDETIRFRASIHKIYPL